MARRYPKANLSAKKARAAVTNLLYGCTPERLAGLTAASLAASYNVSVATAQQMLDAARQGRGL